jgi:hypothetical protein
MSPSTLANLSAYVLFALASALSVYFLLKHVGRPWLAGATTVVMFALKFAAIWGLDVEPFGEVSTYRDGTELPAWLLGLSVFNQYGAWGALGAVLALNRRNREQPRNSIART